MTDKKKPTPAPEEEMHPNGYSMEFMRSIPEGTYIYPKNEKGRRRDETGRLLTKEEREWEMCQ